MFCSIRKNDLPFKTSISLSNFNFATTATEKELGLSGALNTTSGD
jgi:hypothetical protein